MTGYAFFRRTGLRLLGVSCPLRWETAVASGPLPLPFENESTMLPWFITGAGRLSRRRRSLPLVRM